jgi:hypothetical protein
MNEPDPAGKKPESMTIAELFVALKSSVLHGLAHELTVYERLFHEDDGRRDLLANISGHAFEVIHEAIINAITLSVCRLTDHARGGPGKRPNLSLKYLEERLRSENEIGWADNISDCLNRYAQWIYEIDTYRNRLVGHADAQTYVGAEPIAPIKHMDIIEVADALVAVMNEIDAWLTGSSTYYRIMMAYGADALVAGLHDCQRWRALREWVIQRQPTGGEVIDAVVHNQIPSL